MRSITNHVLRKEREVDVFGSKASSFTNYQLYPSAYCPTYIIIDARGNIETVTQTIRHLFKYVTGCSFPDGVVLPYPYDRDTIKMYIDNYMDLLTCDDKNRDVYNLDDVLTFVSSLNLDSLCIEVLRMLLLLITEEVISASDRIRGE